MLDFRIITGRSHKPPIPFLGGEGWKSEERVVFEARLFYIRNPWLTKLPSETLHLQMTEPQMARGVGFSAVRNLYVVTVVYFVVAKGMSCPLKTF